VDKRDIFLEKPAESLAIGEGSEAMLPMWGRIKKIILRGGIGTIISSAPDEPGFIATFKVPANTCPAQL